MLAYQWLSPTGKAWPNYPAREGREEVQLLALPPGSLAFGQGVCQPLLLNPHHLNSDLDLNVLMG